jgi:murein L,D-transpeptidase YafK
MVGFSRLLRIGTVAAAGLAALVLAACSDYGGSLPKHMRPLDSKTRDLVEKKGMEQRSPILIRIFKEESTLEVWKKQKSGGRYAFLKSYDICAWSGVLGPKIKEGDRQAPEGFYTIRPAQMNPNSDYYLAFNMGYPNEFDRSLGRTGAELMVHGACSSRGCYSMTDENIQEIYTLGRLAFQGGQRDFQVQAFPFRMTPENLARHRNSPNIAFWLMLKEGYDHFDAIGQPPKVDVCEHRYIFNSVPADGAAFSASAACPPMMMPEPIRIDVAEKQAEDQEKMLELAARLDRKQGTNGAGAIRLALATPTSVARAAVAPMSVAAAPVSLEPSMTASVAPQAPAAAAAVFSSPAPQAAPVPAPQIAVAPAPQTATAVAEPAVPAPSPAPAAPAPKPVEVAEPAFLPVPELRGSTETSKDEVSLDERMLVESAPADPGVANAYASASEEDGGLTGLVLKLFQEQ